MDIKNKKTNLPKSHIIENNKSGYIQNNGIILEKIEKVIMYPCTGMVLKHCLVEGKKTTNKKRKDAINISTYKSKKYSDGLEVNNINIENSAYLVFEFLRGTNTRKKMNEANPTVYISYPNIYKLINAFKNASKWFLSSHFDQLFFYNKKNSFVVNRGSYSANELIIKINNLPLNRKLSLRPEVIDMGNKQEEQGIAIDLDDGVETVLLTENEFFTLYNFLKNFDLYSTSLTLQNLGQTIAGNHTIVSKIDNLEEKVTNKIDKTEKIINNNVDNVSNKVSKVELKVNNLEDKVVILDEKMDNLEDKVDVLEEKIDTIEERVEIIEDKVDNLENKMDNLENKFDKLEEKVEVIEDKIDNLEDKLEDKFDILDEKIVEMGCELNDKIDRNTDILSKLLKKIYYKLDMEDEYEEEYVSESTKHRKKNKSRIVSRNSKE